jgi:ribosomal protein S18 acetylase RimI-like enzyme
VSDELTGLPGKYARPTGVVLIARDGDEAAGAIAYRMVEPGVAEMKRLYVRPDFQGLGIGKALAEAVIAEAREIGYSSMRLDTVPSMGRAQGLYRALGFREIPPYRFNPVPGTAFLELRLAD